MARTKRKRESLHPAPRPAVADRRLQAYATAIRASLERMKQSGHPISACAVVAGARYPAEGEFAGKSLKRTTLYARSQKDGAFVHQDLLDEIKGAQQEQREAADRLRRHGERLGRLRNRLREKEAVLATLSAQILELDERLEDGERRCRLLETERERAQQDHLITLLMLQTARIGGPELRREIERLRDALALSVDSQRTFDKLAVARGLAFEIRPEAFRFMGEAS